MTSWLPSRWPIRVRVAMAFLAATAVALAALVAFVQVRVERALEDRLRDTLEVEADRLEELPPQARAGSIRAAPGEPYAQALSEDARIEAASPLAPDPMLARDRPTDLLAGTDEAYLDREVTVLDDDAAARGDVERESEPALLLLRRVPGGYLVVGTSRDDADQALGALRNQLLVGGPLALALAGWLGYLVAGAGLRPIERMREAATTISDRTTGERLPLPSADDELRRLATTLNAMLDRLDEGIRRERHFVAEASHELRTPLTLMLVELELARARPRGPEELTSALGSTHEEVRRLVALTDDLLLLASSDAGRLPLDVTDVDLVAVSEAVARRFRAVSGRRAVTVVAPDPVGVRGDALRLERVVSNLVDNALRHGAGDIGLRLGVTDATAFVEVSDDGPGVSDPRPFDRFSGDGRSTGLGLAIAQEIVRSHGGTIHIGRDEGRTVVRVDLPRPARRP